MVKILLVVLFAVTVNNTFSQSKTSEIVGKMNQLALTETASGKTEFKFDEKSGKLILDGLVIPVTGDVILKTAADGSNHKVLFFFQKGNAVSKVSDPSWKRAYFELPLDAKKDALLFIKLYHQLNLSI